MRTTPSSLVTVPDDIASQLLRDPLMLLGIPFALVGAVLMSLGAQYQHRGVRKVESATVDAEAGLSRSQLGALIRRPSWLIGTLFLVLAIVFQLTSLRFSPIMLVQPLGVVALVMTSVLNARISKIKLNQVSIVAVAMCVIGVAVFVTIAAFTAVEHAISDREMVIILILLGVVMIAYTVGFRLFRHRFRAVAYIIAAGVLYGFVVTLAKVVIARLVRWDLSWLTLVCAVTLVGALLLGMYFVQNAYSSGPPDLVIAGLTVIDPIVAVAIGMVVLGEAAAAPLWAIIGFIVTGAIAAIGVYLLARHHPQAENGEADADSVATGEAAADSIEPARE